MFSPSPHLSSPTSRPANAPPRPTYALNIVVAEGDDDLRAATLQTLQAMGHAVRGVASAAALDTLLAHTPATFPIALLLLDLDLPGEDGLHLTQRLRAARPTLGIVLVSERMRLDDKLAGYDSGADLYLSKPLVFPELGALLQALARRMRAARPTPEALTLHPDTLQLVGQQARVNLSQRECTLLTALADAENGRLATARIAEVFGKTLAAFSKYALEVQIVRLRKKLTAAGATAPSIKALRGIGYQLCVSLTISDNRRSAPFAESPSFSHGPTDRTAESLASA